MESHDKHPDLSMHAEGYDGSLSLVGSEMSDSPIFRPCCIRMSTSFVPLNIHDCSFAELRPF
jgi:hypothetical protein